MCIRDRSDIVKESTEGAVMSIVKLSTERLSLVTLLEVAVTLILQFEWRPSLKALKVIVLLLAEAEEVELLQPPAYVIVPDSFVLKV